MRTQEFELMLSDADVPRRGRRIKWHGHAGQNAADRAEDCLGVTVIAWRPIRHGLFIGAPGPGSD